MARAKTTRARRARLLAATVAIAGGFAVAAPAMAVPLVPSVPGLEIDDFSQGVGGHTLSIAMVSTTTLDAHCAGDLILNGVDTQLACTQVTGLFVTGSDKSDTVTVDARGLSPLLPLIDLYLQGGSDVGKVIHAKAATSMNGGPGDDRLSVTMDPSGGAGRDQLWGGDGDDALTNGGFLGTAPTFDPTKPEAAAAWAVQMDGGPGTDIVTGSSVRPDEVAFELADRVALGTGPATAVVTLSQQTELVAIHHNGNYGSKLSVTRAGATWKMTLPSLTSSLHVLARGGPDQITVDGKSARTAVSVDTGTGADVLTLRPWPGYTWSKDVTAGWYVSGKLTQPKAQPISYISGSKYTTVKVVPLP